MVHLIFSIQQFRFLLWAVAPTSNKQINTKINKYRLRGCPHPHNGSLSTIPNQIGIWKSWFLRRRENRNTRRKTSRSKEENQQLTQLPHQATIGGRRVLSPLCYNCSPNNETLLILSLREVYVYSSSST